MIKQLRQKHSQQLADVCQQLNDYHDSISSFNILEDPNFKVEPVELRVSLSSLNENLSSLNLDLQQLNELWVIKGLIAEIEHAEEDVVEVAELEYMVSNVQKLNTKVNSLNNNLVIKLELKTKVSQFEDKIRAILDQTFSKFLPDETTYNDTVVQNEFNDFINVAELTPFENNIKHQLLRHKMKWEALLSKLSMTKLLRLASKDGTHTISFESAERSVDNVFLSALNFVSFINLFRMQSLKQFFANKLSNVLIEAVSGNITELINSNNDKLIEVMDLASNSNWNLSLDLNQDKFDAKLRVIYNNWLVDNFIDKIRQAFKANDFNELRDIKLQEDTGRVNNLEQELDNVERKMDQRWSPMEDAAPKSKEQDDGWDKEDGWEDDGWQEEWDSPGKQKQESNAVQPTTQEGQEEDGWDEDWNEWDDEDKKELETSQAVASTSPNDRGVSRVQQPTKLIIAKVSMLPDLLLETINDFQIESTEDIGILVSTILALASQSYPSIHESFLHYNDLYYLYKNIMSDDLRKYAEKLIKQLKHEKSNELVGILIKLQLTDESNNFGVYRALEDWFDGLELTTLRETNYHQFKELVTSSVELVNNWTCNMVLSTTDITEQVSGKLTNIIDNFDLIFSKKLKSINEDSLPSQNRVHNFRFLINSHLVNIIERFYQGEFYDLATNELIMVIERTFIKSELRDNYINEIIEFRNVN